MSGGLENPPSFPPLVRGKWLINHISPVNFKLNKTIRKYKCFDCLRFMKTIYSLFIIIST